MINRGKYANLCAKSIQGILTQSEPESEKEIAIALTILAEVALTVLRAVIGKEHMSGLIDEIKEHVLENTSQIEVQVMTMRVKGNENDTEKTTAH